MTDARSDAASMILLAAALAFMSLIINDGREAEAAAGAEIELAAVCVDELCGYVNSEGQWHIPPKFRAADPFGQDGLANVILEDGQYVGGTYTIGLSGREGGGITLASKPYMGTARLINTQGEFVDKPLFWMVTSFSKDGLAFVRSFEFLTYDNLWYYDRLIGKWGIINTEGQWLVEPTLDRIYRIFDTGLAVAVADNKCGLINAKGEWIVEPDLDEIWFKDLSLYRHIFGLDGKFVPKPKPKYGPIETLGLARKNGQYGFLDTEGQWVINLQPGSTGLDLFFVPGLAKIYKNGKLGLINTKGQWVLDAKYDEISNFYDNSWAKVKSGGKYGIINIDCQVVIEPAFDQLDASSGNALIPAGMHGKWGFIDPKGQWLVQPRFDGLRALSGQDMAAAAKDGQWGFINSRGQWLIEPQFAEVRDFFDNGLALVKSGGQYGLVNTRGQWAVEPQFDEVGGFFDNGLAYAKQNSKYGLINTRGLWVVQPQFEDIYSFSDKGLKYAKIKGKLGIVDTTGQWLIKPHFISMILSPHRGSLREIYVSHVKYDIYGKAQVRVYMDSENCAYRTGLARTLEEPGFHWELTGGLRTLYNRQGKKILTVDPGGEFEVARNAAGEVIWPLGDAPPRDKALGCCPPPPISTFSF